VRPALRERIEQIVDMDARAARLLADVALQSGAGIAKEVQKALARNARRQWKAPIGNMAEQIVKAIPLPETLEDLRRDG